MEISRKGGGSGVGAGSQRLGSMAQPIWGGLGKRWLLSVVLCGVLTIDVESRAANLIVNWGFDSGLDGWETEGTVAPSGGLAVLSDDGATESQLYQIVATEPGRHELRFDFWNLTSDSVPGGTFPDTAVATIYLIEDPSAFDSLAGTGFAQSIDLMDADADGESILAAGAEIEPAPVDDRLSTFSFAFDNPLGLMVAIVFRLMDFNFEDNDSRFLIDDVALTRPEATIEIWQEDGFIVIEAGAILELSRTLADEEWVELGRSEYPVVTVPARPDGRATKVRVIEAGTGVASLVEGELLPGFRLVEFLGGRLQVAGEGLDDWTDIPDSPGPTIIADPGSRRLFYRSVLP